MADRLQESVEIIRRDRDRSRDFLADVSHELRTPLAALRMFNELLEGGAGRRPRGPRRVPRVERPADRAARLAGPEPARALEARFGPRPARPAAGRSPGGRRERQSTRRATAAAARRPGVAPHAGVAGPHPARPAADRPGRRQPRRQRREVHAAWRLDHGRCRGDGRGRADRGRATPASASMRPSCPTSSNGSIAARGPTRRAAAGAASGWRSSVRSSTCTVARSSSRARSGVGTPFIVDLPEDPRLVAGTPAAERADVASAAETGSRRTGAAIVAVRAVGSADRQRAGNFTHRTPAGESKTCTVGGRPYGRSRPKPAGDARPLCTKIRRPIRSSRPVPATRPNGTRSIRTAPRAVCRSSSRRVDQHRFAPAPALAVVATGADAGRACVPASTTGVFGTPHPSSGSDAFGSTAAPAGYVSPTAPVTPVRPGSGRPAVTSEAADAGPAVERYTPAPEIRPDWTRTWDETTSGTPERWYEPAPAAAATAAPAKRRRTGGGAGPLIAASLLSAILAAGGTVMALSAAGALDRPAPSAAPAVAQASSAASVTARPRRRAVGDDRGRLEGQPGGREDQGHRRRRHRQRRHPPDRRRLGRHLRPERLDPHQPSRRRGRDQVRRRAQGRPACFTGTVYGIDTPHRPRDRQGRRNGAADRRDRRVRYAQGRPAGRRDRQPARDILELGHERHRVGQGPLDPRRRQPVARRT